MKEGAAVTVAVLVVPFIPGTALGLSIIDPLTGWPHILTVLGLLPMGYLFSLIAMVLFGIPAYLLGRRLNLVRWWSSMISGFVVGVLVCMIIFNPIGRFHLLFTFNTGRSALIYGALGSVSAFVFWVIWKQGQNSVGGSAGTNTQRDSR